MKTLLSSLVRPTFNMIVIIMVGLLVSLAGCSGQSDTDQTLSPVAVRVTKPEIRDMTAHVTYTGTVHSSNEFTAIAQVQGTVTALPFAEGQPINNGDVLLTLSTPDIEATVDRLRAEFNYWNERYASDIKLAIKGAVPQEQVAVSKKAFESSKASLREAESKFEKAAERASFDGVVLKHFVDLGQTVMPGMPLLQIGNDELEILAEVVQEDVRSNIRPGTIVIVHDGNGRLYESQVSEVAPVSSNRSRTFTVKVSLPASLHDRFRVGEAVVIDFVLESSERTLTVPITAVSNRDSDPYIFLIRENHAVKTPVLVGIQQSESFAVQFDWNGSDLVAISNVASLTDGDLVYQVYVEGQLP
ncbi:MAG: hypothetical protein DRP47_02655 [Candidatus Zixiibacteriota bacterium]|nr:MAG: hypothetical protein DRP47_02655 [candidate division Zixibacteria bacterium]